MSDTAFYSIDNGLPDYVDFQNMSKTVKNVVIKFIISECLSVAGKYNGKCYGGFVRDVLVPLSANRGNSNFVSNWKDVDIWFTTETDMKSFIKDMGRKLKAVRYQQSITEEKKNVLYNWPRNQYHLYIWNICVSFVDVIVFNTYIWGDCGDVTVEGKVRESVTVDYIQKCIINKVATMDREYIDMLSDEEHGLDRLERIQKRYINRGWKVMVGEKELKLGSSLTCTTWSDFVKNFKEYLYSKFLDEY
tara:strand:- start:1194 stop:1934 length:741 start_codon:yes stop_codon:yes gene_type:complete